MAKYYDISEIFKSALKFYSSGKVFKDMMYGGELFPLEIKLNAVKQKDIQTNFSTLMQEIQKLKKEPFELLYREYNFKSVGIQKLPIVVKFPSRDSFLEYVGKREEFSRYRRVYGLVVQRYEVFKELLEEKPFLVLEYETSWERLFLVCEYFSHKLKKPLYIRELSIKGVDTKFIEKHKNILDKLLMKLLPFAKVDESINSLAHYGFEKKYGLKYPQSMVRFRVLDKLLYISGLSDLSVTIEEFHSLHLKCKNIFIVENKITTLSFPSMQESIVIFGSGYGVEVLKGVEWFKEKKIYYWGDIDRDGFAILSQIRGYYPQVESFCMDEKTIKNSVEFSSEDTNKKKSPKELAHLSQEEKIVYNKLLKDSYGENFRLEQERIDFEYVKSALEYI